MRCTTTPAKFLTRNQLASNFVTFFEKLCITIERLAARLPRFEEIQLAMPESKSKVTHRLTESLLKFYADLFEFFQAVALVFSCRARLATVTLRSSLLFDSDTDSLIESVVDSVVDSVIDSVVDSVNDSVNDLD